MVAIVQVPGRCIGRCAFPPLLKQTVLLCNIEAAKDEEGCDVEGLELLQVISNVRVEAQWEASERRDERFLVRGMVENALAQKVGCINSNARASQLLQLRHLHQIVPGLEVANHGRMRDGGIVRREWWLARTKPWLWVCATGGEPGRDTKAVGRGEGWVSGYVW
jgi:hypothetical protein